MKQPESELYVDTSRDEDLLIKNDPKFESGELRGMTKDHWRVRSLHFSFFSFFFLEIDFFKKNFFF